MVEQGSGVLIFVTGSPARPHGPGAAAVGAAFAATENFMRTLAIELGPAGVRSVGLRIAANPDTRTIQDTTLVLAKHMGVSQDAVARRARSIDDVAEGGFAADEGYRPGRCIPRV